MRRILACCVTAVSVVVMTSVTASASPVTTLVVDDDGAQCGNADYRTISQAVAATAPGGTVRVCAGVYRERVQVTKQLHLVGQADAVGKVNCVDESWSSTDAV